jgi:putative ABC transport system substrate-binding protein
VPNIDLLVIWSTVGGVIAKRVSTLPVVFLSVGAPVEIGLVKSLSHPGGNMTGVTFEAASETYAKRLQILKDIVPNLERVGILGAAGDANVAFAMVSLDHSAPQLGVTLLPVYVGSTGEINAAFETMMSNKAQGLIVIAGALTYSAGAQIADLTLAHHLPSCNAFKETVAEGGLVSLGPDLVEMAKQGAVFADKIIRGASPADLPVEQPSRYELHVNLKTAKALGLTVPLSLLGRADEVIK